MGKYKPDLSELNRHWRRMLYSKIENIFSYTGLPEEINERALKLGLFLFGKLIFYKIKDKFLVQNFSYTDKLDWYYVPKNGRVVNPWLPQGFQNFEFEVDKEAVIWNSTPDIYSFKLHSIVSDLVYKTANQLSENDISYYCIQRNARLVAIFVADSDLEKAECNRVLERMYNGEPDITMAQDLISHITTMPISDNSQRGRITELIEFQQYILANFYHSFGINSNYNLKREQLNSSEIDVNKEVLRLNIDDMLKCREEGVKKINDLYGLSIGVSLNEEVYKTLLQEENALFAGTGNIPTMSETPENTTSSGESEDESKSQDSEFDATRDSDVGENDEQSAGSEKGDETGEINSEGNEDNKIQISIKADNIEEITINSAENEPNLSENERSEDDGNDEEHDSGTMETEKSDD